MVDGRQRCRAGRLLGAVVRSPYRPLAPGVGPRSRQVLTERATWRDLAGTLTNIVTAVPLGVLAVLLVGNAVLGAVTTILWWAFPLAARPQVFDIPITDWGRALTLGPASALAAAGLAVVLLPFLSHWHARLSRAMLAPSAADLLEARVEVLTRTRAGAVDAFAAELRRIERDTATRRSRGTWSSPKVRCTSTSATSSPSSDCHRTTAATGASWRSWPTSTGNRAQARRMALG